LVLRAGKNDTHTSDPLLFQDLVAKLTQTFYALLLREENYA
jgi:hypothetical protein